MAVRVLLIDLERGRESLCGFIGDVKMIPGDKHGEFIVEARMDDAALIRNCLK